jgi:Zn-finger nucleic acid-binding protein
MQPEALNCPNCGGAVSSDKTQCEFCRSRLKTVGCPSCLGVMFLGSKFCGRCGAKAVTAEVVSNADSGQCPRCKVKLELVQIDSANIRECTRCGGLWSGIEAFEELCASKEQQVAVLGLFSDSTDRSVKPSTISYVPCPDCKELMNRSNFARTSGVIIDLCKKHGVWFDRDELPKIIEFITGGGMQRSREKERVVLEEELSKLRDDQRRQKIQDQRHGLKTTWESETESPVRKFVKMFFD